MNPRNPTGINQHQYSNRLTVLVLILLADQPLTAGDLAELTKQPLKSIHAVLSVLVQRGSIVRGDWIPGEGHRSRRLYSKSPRLADSPRLSGSPGRAGRSKPPSPGAPA